MYHSLQRLARLPLDTAVYCTHEYTEHNLHFASTLEPENRALKRRQAEARQLRAANQPTLPSSIGLELETNPFLRCDQAAIQLAASLNAKTTIKNNPISVFTNIREMRNHY
jgi:hydroxyacylglutathione hydrolase